MIRVYNAGFAKALRTQAKVLFGRLELFPTPRTPAHSNRQDLFPVFKSISSSGQTDLTQMSRYHSLGQQRFPFIRYERAGRLDLFAGCEPPQAHPNGGVSVLPRQTHRL